MPGFVLPRPDALASDWWLVPAARAQDVHGQPAPLILLVRPGARIGSRAAGTGLATLPARTAELILTARLSMKYLAGTAQASVAILYPGLPVAVEPGPVRL